jgi:DNA/RNA endonuclease YhcR with UshA esterase domain
MPGVLLSLIFNKAMKKIILSIILCSKLTISFGQIKITAKDAASHIGEIVIVCDKVFSTKLITGSNMTVLNLGGYYPNQLLTVMIEGKDRRKFKDAPEEAFKGRTVCVTGKIIEYKGKPEIVVSDPSELKLDPTNNVVPAPTKY